MTIVSYTVMTSSTKNTDCLTWIQPLQWSRARHMEHEGLSMNTWCEERCLRMRTAQAALTNELLMHCNNIYISQPLQIAHAQQTEIHFMKVDCIYNNGLFRCKEAWISFYKAFIKLLFRSDKLTVNIWTFGFFLFNLFSSLSHDSWYWLHIQFTEYLKLSLS